MRNGDQAKATILLFFQFSSSQSFPCWLTLMTGNQYLSARSGRLERPSTIAEFARLVYSTLNTVRLSPVALHHNAGEVKVSAGMWQLNKSLGFLEAGLLCPQ